MIEFKYKATWHDIDGMEIEFKFWVYATNENRAHMEAMIRVEWFAKNCKEILTQFEYDGVEILEIVK